MMRIPTLVAALLCAAAPLTAQEQPGAQDLVSQAFQSWQSENGGQWLLRVRPETGAVQHLYGSSVEASFAPRNDAEWFELGRMAFDQAFGMFGIADSTLTPQEVKHLRLSHLGTTDKVAVKFLQERLGIPVVRGSATALFTPGGELLSLDTTGLPGVESVDTNPVKDRYEAVSAAGREFALLEARKAEYYGVPELVIDQHEAGRVARPRLAWAIEVRHDSGEGAPSRRRIYVAADRQASEILGNENLVHHFQGPNDIQGHVDAWATPGVLPDTASNPETLHPMPHMTVTSSIGNTTTDASGDFVIPYAGGPNVDVTFSFVGPYARVLDDSGAEYSLTQSFAPGVFANAEMNPGRTATETAEANSFRVVNEFREWVKSIDPAETRMDFQVLANVNLNSTCNAFFNGSSINMYLAGGGCVNTSYTTVVAHEEGHWANVLFGNGNPGDGFGEGAADVWAMYLYDTPIVGENFCGTGCNIRTGNNTRQWCGSGCYGQVHADGEVLMGALWKVRRNFNTTYGNTPGDDLANGYFLAWMQTWNDGISPIVEEHWLTLDDDDGNIFNGTPNFDDIDGAFREQGFPGVDIVYIDIVHTPLPDTQNENGPYTVDAVMTPQFGGVVTNADVVYSVDGGPELTVPMSNTGGNNWTGDIPGQTSVARVSYRIEAFDNQGNTQLNPRSGDHMFLVGVVQVVEFNDFEGLTDEGWTHALIATQDDWQRDVPQGKAGDPGAAYSGTKVWANDVGNPGWNGEYQPNVNNYLESPAFDLSGRTGTWLRFRRHLGVEKRNSLVSPYDEARIKVNGTTVWENPLATNVQDTEWTLVEYDISAIADNNPSVVVRFELISDPGVQFGGWTIDNFELVTINPVPGNKDQILLSGTTNANVGDLLTYDMSNLPPLSQWWLGWSQNTNGTVIAGHAFDLGTPFNIAATGTSDAAGTASWTSTPVPAAGSGLTIFIEAGARDGGGVITDSNVVTLVIN